MSMENMVAIGGAAFAGWLFGSILNKVKSVLKGVGEIKTTQSVHTAQLYNIITSLQLIRQEMLYNNVMPGPRMSGPTPGLPFPGPMLGVPPTFKSIDGKYSADSLEELVEKMMTDPKSNITPSDLDTIKKVFEQISMNISFDTFDDEGDDEDDSSSWNPNDK